MAIFRRKNSKQLVNQVKTLLNQVGIGEKLWSKFTNQLSGGESQRVGIVRAIINTPKIVFADEPIDPLNSATSEDVLDVFSKVNDDGQSIVMVTHDIKIAIRGNRIIYLQDGYISGELKLEKYSEIDLNIRRENILIYLT